MFGLPDTTALLLVGIPLFWIAYTAVFLWVSRSGRKDDSAGAP